MDSQCYDAFGCINRDKNQIFASSHLISFSFFPQDIGGYAFAGLTVSYGPGGIEVWLVKTIADGRSLNGEGGLVWVDSPADTVALYRGKHDASWIYVRVRILEAKK